MFSPALGGVIRSTGNTPLSSTSSKRLVAAVASNHQQPTWTQAPHYHLRHRRLSSSKTSFPPDGSKPSPKTALPETSHTDTKAETYATKTAATKSSSKSLARNVSLKNTTTEVAKEVLQPPIRQLNIPYVAPLRDFTFQDFRYASLFAMHRPISTVDDRLGQGPLGRPSPETTMLQFRSIIRMPIFEGLRLNEDAVAKYKSKSAIDPGSQPDLNHYLMGWWMSQKLNQTTNSPGNIVFLPLEGIAAQIADPAKDQQTTADVDLSQPSGQRVRRRKMFAISVKRQRKLKMKKHKYKKLMKRTRLLRKKLDRL